MSFIKRACWVASQEDGEEEKGEMGWKRNASYLLCDDPLSIILLACGIYAKKPPLLSPLRP